MSQGIQTIGTCIGFLASLPATEDQAGYEALSGWEDSEEVTGFGAVGPVNSTLTFTTVCDGKENKRPGPTNNGTQNLTIAWDSLNGAQDLLWTARKNRTKISVKLTLSSGDVVYYQAYVMSVLLNLNDILQSEVTLEIDTDLVLVKRTP